jgi:mono/diheme cytochrome c family protein
MNKVFLVAAASAIILSACGGSTKTEEQPKFASDAVKSDANADAGATIYQRTCVTCHMANGEGIPNTFPPLAKSDYLADKEKTIHQVVKGSSGELIVNGQKYNNTMPPQPLNDEEVAQVLTYVYSAFGNGGTVTVTPEEVKAARAK